MGPHFLLTALLVTAPAPAAGLSPAVPAASRPAVETAQKAWRHAVESGAVRRPEVLTVIDYSRPSTEPRLFVLEMPSGRVVFQELVAHGRGSGENATEHFSNAPGSRMTSLGVFLSGAPYLGHNGLSLRLDGLEAGFNDAARERDIVLHGAPYVSTRTATTLGRLGRSWGCPAVRPEIAARLIDAIRDGSLVVAYYPDRDWLARSEFLAASISVAPR
ncbi:MAG TPA: murein L,D-transpeptidase catalytic domain family protein [Thermoanaerobaculia bacterium]|nr:murein L,D-transpeptidase catalytic domain family protein [Thermoanaerobaculia bacterium]